MKLITLMLFVAVMAVATVCLPSEIEFGGNSFGVAYPDAKLTPGDVMPDATARDVCQAGYARAMRGRLSRAMKRHIYSRYGIKYDTRHYQIDHLVPLSLGGSNDELNLWPQPILQNAGFYEKQQAAVYLHDRVCRNQLDLQRAQEMMKTDWHAVFKDLQRSKQKVMADHLTEASNG